MLLRVRCDENDPQPMTDVPSSLSPKGPHNYGDIARNFRHRPLAGVCRSRNRLQVLDRDRVGRRLERTSFSGPAVDAYGTGYFPGWCLGRPVSSEREVPYHGMADKNP